jgi:hypothetical protein
MEIYLTFIIVAIVGFIIGSVAMYFRMVFKQDSTLLPLFIKIHNTLKVKPKSELENQHLLDLLVDLDRELESYIFDLHEVRTQIDAKIIEVEAYK